MIGQVITSETSLTIMTQKHESLFLALTKWPVKVVLQDHSWLSIPGCIYLQHFHIIIGSHHNGHGRGERGQRFSHCSRIEGTSAISAHNPLTRTSHMTLLNRRGYKEVQTFYIPRRELGLQVRVGSVYHSWKLLFTFLRS